jgi:hypothetical protein
MLLDKKIPVKLAKILSLKGYTNIEDKNIAFALISPEAIPEWPRNSSAHRQRTYSGCPEQL